MTDLQANPKIAVIIVRWGGGDEVQKCLRAVINDTDGANAEILLVDSGSGDGGVERLARQFPTIAVLELEENRSFAWASNCGVEATDAHLIYLLNPDTEVEMGSTARLVDFLENNAAACGAVPLLIGTDGRPQHRWQLRRLPGPLRLALGRPGAPAFGARLPDRPAPIEQPAAAAWLIRRSAWQELGGLDPDFAPAWWEDVDFCRRLTRRPSASGDVSAGGFWLVPDSRVSHRGASSLDRLGSEVFQIAYTGNLIRYARRHHRRSLPVIKFVLRWSLRLRSLARPKLRHAYRAALRDPGIIRGQ